MAMPPFLRDSPDTTAGPDRVELQAELDAAVRAGDEREEMRLNGLLADMVRIGGEDGRPLARRAVELADRLEDEPAWLANRIRLATAQFYLGQHREAESELRSVIDEIGRRGTDRYLDFAMQHLGKCLAEQERFDEALECFGAALDLRTDPALRASSQRAIDAARAAAAGR